MHLRRAEVPRQLRGGALGEASGAPAGHCTACGDSGPRMAALPGKGRPEARLGQVRKGAQARRALPVGRDRLPGLRHAQRGELVPQQEQAAGPVTKSAALRSAHAGRSTGAQAQHILNPKNAWAASAGRWRSTRSMMRMCSGCWRAQGATRTVSRSGWVNERVTRRREAPCAVAADAWMPPVDAGPHSRCLARLVRKGGTRGMCAPWTAALVCYNCGKLPGPRA